MILFKENIINQHVRVASKLKINEYDNNEYSNHDNNDINKNNYIN